jgi:shikimate kinase
VHRDKGDVVVAVGGSLFVAAEARQALHEYVC